MAKKRDELDDLDKPTCEGYVSEESVRRYFTLDELLKEAEEPEPRKKPRRRPTARRKRRESER
jgi:hypothetical protein